MLENNLIIIVCDTQRAHIFKNTGSKNTPHLDFISGFEQKNPRSHEYGSDKPGTTFGSASGPRSHVASEDFHMEEQKIFAKTIVNSIMTIKRDNTFSKMIWVAPPKMLSYLREIMPLELKNMTIFELSKDLTKHPTPEIIKIIKNHLEIQNNHIKNY